MIRLIASRKGFLSALDACSVMIVYKADKDTYVDINGKKFKDNGNPDIDGITVYELDYDEEFDKIYLVEHNVVPMGGAL
jgi:hypothetical protein